MRIGRFKLPIDTYLLLLIGTVCLAAVLPVRGAGAEVFDKVVVAAIALLFFLYGARLSPAAVWDGLMHWRLQSLVFASTYVVFPLIGLAVSYLARGVVTDDLLTGIVYLCVLPSTVQSSIAFTSIARGNVPAALTSASVSNMLGVFLTPALVALLLHAQGGVHLQSLIDIASQILLPFALDQLARRWVADLMKRHARLTSFVDRGSILLVVYSAFSEGMVAGIWSRVSLQDLAWVIGLAVAILVAAMLFTSLTSRLFGFSREDRIAIVFCGSKKSLATGIPMAGILFAGQAVPLIILPVMLFHQIQLFACAFLAQRYAAEVEKTPQAKAQTAKA